ncbi:S-layer homology domain-containing protein [Paenibacillus contaminans]|uniref:SLH domain-containing protein n=1 Tax=Paenibacillus contaminans TaxID=450362 RepID=A0A329MPY5_9BACL|nr:S-layer homology domain-containing protein [Paenibacillus contaminans]RAV21528.1 hypothetical protein DQG23_09685 [Paenibacillus contaminans]
MLIRRSFLPLLIGICLLLAAWNAVYADDSHRQLSVGNASGRAGDHLAIPIMLASDGAVTALQFQLSYSENTLELTELRKGTNLPAAFSVFSNIGTGKVVIGSLGSIIEAGNKEVAVAVFKVKDGAAPGSYDIRLANAQLSDGNAESLTHQFQIVHGSLTVVPPAGSNPTVPPATPSPTTPPADTGFPGSQTDAVVLINGRAADVGITTTTTVDTKRVITVVLNPEKLARQLASEAEGAVIVIPVETASDVIIGELDGQIIQDMEQKQAVVKLQTARAIYSLPAEQVNIQALAARLGAGAQLQNIKIRIEIAEPSNDMLRVIEDTANRGSFTLAVPPVQFSVKGVYGDTVIDIAQFNAYVERMITISEGADPGKVSTVVVIEPDGIVRHVPTQIVLMEGKYYARVNSLTNSVYALVWHPVTFRDMTGHWAEEAVNDMGSRMVINGTGEGMFDPDRDITRAEFASIVVRGLGLKPITDSAYFTDVMPTDWYNAAVQTAHEYGLVQGSGDGVFQPNDKITREQAMVIIANAMEITKLKASLPERSAEERLQPFEDAAEISGWAKGGVADSVQAGVVSGRTENQLAPQAYLTRAEVAAMVQKLLQKSELI